jgi:hypothetical protein
MPKSQAEEVSKVMTHPSRLGIPLGSRLAEGDPVTGHADWETEIGTGIIVVSRLLGTDVVMVRVKGDISEIAGYGTEWKHAVVDLLQAHRDWESAEGLAT